MEDIAPVLLFAAAMFCFGIASVIYVAFRFLSIAISLDSAILRGIKNKPQEQVQQPTEPPLESKLREFISSRLAPTQGDFVPYADEVAFLNEQVESLRSKGLTEEELNQFIRQAVTEAPSASEQENR